MIDRMTLMKVHVVLAAFILPAALMFMITGALYSWDIKGSYSNDVHEIPLNKPIQSDIAELTALAQLELDKLSTTYPEGKPTIKVYGSHYLLEWSGSSKDVILEPTANDRIAKLTVKHTTWYRNLVQLHKAKGGTAFKVYAVAFALALLALLISGFIMAWQTPKLKRITLITTLAGLGSFVIFVFIS